MGHINYRKIRLHCWLSLLSGCYDVFHCAKYWGFKSEKTQTQTKNINSRIVILSLGVFCVHFAYVYKIPRETGCIFLMRELSYKNIKIRDKNNTYPRLFF